MPKPVRVQRKRTPGWRMPENTVYVGRPTKWGNPFIVTGGGERGRELAVKAFRELVAKGEWNSIPPVELLIRRSSNKVTTIDEVRRELRGKNLSCWCPLNQPCHADVLLEIANSEVEA